MGCLKSFMAGVHQGPQKGPISSWVLDALSCSLSLMFRHSGTKWDTKTIQNIVNQNLGEGRA